MSEIVRVKVGDVIPYENNPRINDAAVHDVAESIRECGYMAKIIVDENMVVLAGHTRLKAVKRLGWDAVDVQVERGLSEEQKRKYRLLDNKTGEAAQWDFDKLKDELEGLDFSEFDLDFGIISPDDYGEDFSLPDGEKEPFVTMTFTLANEQAVLIKQALMECGEPRETFGNSNSNGNRLYEVMRQWAMQNRSSCA